VKTGKLTVQVWQKGDKIRLGILAMVGEVLRVRSPRAATVAQVTVRWPDGREETLPADKLRRGARKKVTTEPAKTSQVQRVVNTHDQLIAMGGGVAIVVSHGGARTDYVDGFLVYRVVGGRAVVTDPDTAWYHHGRKWFSNSAYRNEGHHKAQAKAALDAQRWVREQGWYDGPWVRNGQRDWVPDEVNRLFPIRRTPLKAPE